MLTIFIIMVSRNMQTFAKGRSTSETAQLILPAFADWVIDLQKISKVFRYYGSFLPSQLSLLRNVHSGINSTESPVLVFGAPPSSGKTHVIALCASYFESKGFSSCVVTPNTELIRDFQRELRRVEISAKPQVLNIGAYVRRKDDFRICLVDEAHNLRSALEMSPEVVTTVRIDSKASFYPNVRGVLEQTHSLQRELSPEDAHDLVVRLVDHIHSNPLKRILGSLTMWRVFVVESDFGLEVKFLAADPTKRNLLPRNRLLLFSATPLDRTELEFYCNIPHNSVVEYQAPREEAGKANVRYRFVPCATYDEKLAVAMTILGSFKEPVLILINNNKECNRWSLSLSKTFKSRLVSVCSHLPYSERLTRYERFIRLKTGILVTSSSAYWEGINIKNLKMVVIPDRPYPKPTLLEIASKGTNFETVSKRRLIQGVGRVGRSPNTVSMCILLFKPRGMTGIFGLATNESLGRDVSSMKNN